MKRIRRTRWFRWLWAHRTFQRAWWWVGYHGVYQLGWRWRWLQRRRHGVFVQCRAASYELVGDAWIGDRCRRGALHPGRHQPIADAYLELHPERFLA